MDHLAYANDVVVFIHLKAGVECAVKWPTSHDDDDDGGGEVMKTVYVWMKLNEVMMVVEKVMVVNLVRIVEEVELEGQRQAKVGKADGCQQAGHDHRLPRTLVPVEAMMTEEKVVSTMMTRHTSAVATAHN
jgi:hypothetical protein